MSQAKVWSGRKSGRTPYPTCRRCGTTILPRTTYYRYSAGYRQPVYSHCALHYPLPSELESNSTIASALTAHESLAQAILATTSSPTPSPAPFPSNLSLQPVLNALESAISTLEDCVSEQEDKISNTEEHNLPTDSLEETLSNLEEYLDSLASAKDSIESELPEPPDPELSPEELELYNENIQDILSHAEIDCPL